MTERTESLTRRTAGDVPGPAGSDVVPGPAGNDVLSDALRVFRVTGAALMRGEFTAPCAVDVPEVASYAQLLHPGATRIMILHVITQGSCWIESGDGPRHELREGDVVSFPLGHAHRMGIGEGGASVYVTSLLPMPPWTELPVIRHGGGGAPGALVCVYLRCDELLHNPILGSLPPLLVFRPDQHRDTRWIRANLEHIVREASIGRPGCGCVIARLTELLFIEILRCHIENLPEGATGWLAALGDPHLARALACFHSEPARQWTLDDVAREAAMSRTALLDNFQRVLGTSPMRYLTTWRLQLVAQALHTTRRSLAQIAEDVGYSSESALSRAFKRETGVGPAGWRQGIRSTSA